MAGKDGPKVMTEKHVAAITKNYAELTANLTVNATLLSKLVAKDIITMAEEEDLQEEKGSTTRASKLLQLVRRREDDAYYVIIDALKDCKMAALAKLLEDADSEGGARSEAAKKATDSKKPVGENTNGGAVAGPMTEEHKDLLDEKRMELIGSMDVPLTLDKLRALKVFMPREAREIRAAANGSEAQAGELLDRLQKKDDSAFGKFITALRETKQPFLANLLE